MTTPDIFLSYNREDAATAKRYADAFAAEGLNVWWDTALRSGEAYDEVTEAALRGAKAVVVLWSPRSVVSRWVRAEATIADRCKTLVPVMIEACERPIMFELTQTAELSHWDGDRQDPAWLSFLSDVQLFIGREPIERTPRQSVVTPLSPQPAFAPNKIAVAVLPLVDMTAAQDQAELILGLSEEIEAGIMRLDCYVAVHHSPVAGPRNLDAIARALGVSYVLDGSVRGRGKQLRIAAKLAAPLAGDQLWTESFDGTPDDGFDLQDRVASAIAAQLEASIMAAEVRRIAALSEEQRTAFEFYLLARATALGMDRPSLEAALLQCERALALDPTFALAGAMSGWCHALLYQSGWTNDPTETLRRGQDHLSRAIRRDENNLEVLRTYATASCCLGGDLTAVEAMLARALKRSPDDPTLQRALGWPKVLMGGKQNEALALFASSLELDSSSKLVVFAVLGQSVGQFTLRNFDEAARLAREVISRRPEYGLAHAVFIASLAHLGKLEDAKHALGHIPPETPFSVLLDVTRDAGDRELLRSGLAMAGANV
jgi:TolB-like protein